MPGTPKSYKEKALSRSPRKCLCIVVLSIIPCLRKTVFFFFFFFTIKATFIQVAFKNIQRLLWKIQGLFKARAKKGLTESEVWWKVLSNNVIVTL